MKISTKMALSKFNEIKEKSCKKIKEFDFKESLEKIFVGKIDYNDCSSKLERQFRIYETNQAVFFLLFMIVAMGSYYLLEKDVRNYPIIGIFLFEMIIFFLLFTKKLFIKIKEGDNEWFKTPDFQNVAIHYFLTRKHYKGQIQLFLIFLSLALITSYTINIAANYNNESNQNSPNPIMDIYHQILLEKPDSKNMIIDLMFVFPWMPLALLFSTIMFRAKLRFEKDFEYYFAYATIKTLNECEKSRNTTRFQLFKICLELYSEFLRNQIKLSLDNIDKIYSSVIGNPKISQNEIYANLLVKFDDQDLFKPLKYLGEIVGEDTSLVTRIKTSEKIMVWLPILLSIILGIINVIRLIFPVATNG